jgi:hypothetical protein
VTHLAHENGHTGLHVVEIQIERHLKTFRIQHSDALVYLVPGNEETIEFPFNTHKEDTILAVNMLVQIHNIALVVRDEFGYLTNDALSVGTMQQKDGGRVVGCH